MTKTIVIAISIGGLIGYFFLPESFLHISEYLIIGGLCGMLFLVGLDIGYQGTAWRDIKKAGWRILMFPIATIVGTLAGAGVASLFLSITLPDSLAVASGFGWYSFAPMLIAPYSTSLSAMSFLHNVFRETIGIVMIPIIAKKVGFIETISLPGSATMDVCVPIIEEETNGVIAIYSFINGICITSLTPALVSLFINM